LVEAHRLRTPSNATRSRADGSSVVNGVRIDKYRRRLEYWLTKDEVSPSRTITRVGEMRKYPARDEDGHRQVFHIYFAKRATQTRGITAFAPIFDLLGQFEDLNFAKIVQAQIVSCVAIFREREIGFGGPAAAQRGERSTETLSDGSTRLVEGLSPGMEIPGAPGEKLSMNSPNVPNPEFFPHVKLLLTLVGVNIGMPLVMVLMDASETNFSGWRGAVDQARMGFRRNQRRLCMRLHRPVYLWQVRGWIESDPTIKQLAAQGKIDPFRHRWNPPTWPYIEPLKDASADLLRVRNALISPRRLHNERGREWSEIAREIVEDNALAIRQAREAAGELNKEFNDNQDVHWRELLSLPTPDGVQIKLAADGGESDRNQPQRTGASNE